MRTYRLIVPYGSFNFEAQTPTLMEFIDDFTGMYKWCKHMWSVLKL